MRRTGGQARCACPPFRENAMKDMRIRLVTLAFDAAGQGEKTEYTYRGRYEECGSLCRLLWQREEEGVSTQTVLSFDARTRTAVSMQQTGGCESQMHFAPGEEQASLYRVPGAGELAMTVRTERVENELSPEGGRLRLAYEMHLGGERRRVILTLTAG